MPLTKAAIASHRLINQQIAGTNFTEPEQIVQWLGAVQAQDYPMSKWAIGLRLPDGTNEMVEKAINKGAIIRTHILRPTWHFVAAADIHWMLTLTSPHIKRIAASMNRNLELTDKTLKKTNSLLTKSLTGNNHLTRQELMKIVNKAGIPTDTLRAAHIMFAAELDGLVCNGPIRGKEFTYALLSERITVPPQNYSREEALSLLAKRYFTSHGPATIHDMAWWSGLNLKDVQQGLDLCKSELASQIIDGKTYWFVESNALPTKTKNSLHLLPAFDEFLVGYKDRTASLPVAKTRDVITVNGIFKPVVVVNGKVEGFWKREINKGITRLSLDLFDPSYRLQKKTLGLALSKYSGFLNTKAEVVY
jgi:hypothetical protein